MKIPRKLKTPIAAIQSNTLQQSREELPLETHAPSSLLEAETSLTGPSFEYDFSRIPLHASGAETNNTEVVGSSSSQSVEQEPEHATEGERSSEGQPLNEGTRAAMESRFGYDFRVLRQINC